MKSLLAMFSLIATTFCCDAQSSDLNFLIEKIKVDYPGFKEKTMGIDFNQFVSQTLARNKHDTFKVMGLIIDLFQDRHLNLLRINNSSKVDTQSCFESVQKLKRHIQRNESVNQSEGYWVNDDNNAVIILVKNKSQGYSGYVTESLDSNILFPGTTAYVFDSIAPNLFLTRFTSSYTGAVYYLRSYFKSDSILITGASGKWRKLNNYNHPIIKDLPRVEERASAALLDKDNFLITIPLNTRENTKIVDSIVRANSDLIGKTRNLIIDLRQNMGGGVGTYKSLLPFVYTNPIAKINGERYYTEDYIGETKKEIESYAKSENVDSSYLKNRLLSVKQMEAYVGQFLMGQNDTLYFDSVRSNPKNVGVIVNYAVQSAAEMMLLDFKQSKKVKIFGEHTAGAVDYLDVYSITFPSGKYKLNIPMTRRIIPPGASKLDYKGIYPDIDISDSNKNWVEFVRKYYEKN